jgi:hypothetical protein
LPGRLTETAETLLQAFQLFPAGEALLQMILPFRVKVRRIHQCLQQLAGT